MVSTEGVSVPAHETLDPKKLSLFTFAGDRWAAAVSELGGVGPGVTLIAAQLPSGADRDEVIRLYELGETGAVLVRPDGHTVWRTSTSGDDATRELSEFVHRHWGRYFAASALEVGGS